jgi:WD40 repeat protein
VARYDAFVSYSHAGEADVARRLQEGVERFAKPWYRTRSLRLFLDKNSLTASPSLWSSIETALADSRWLVLVCSPSSVQSPWIDREIRWWLEHRSAETLLIVVAGGGLVWDDARGDFDPDASSALPPALGGVFGQEPHWVSLPGRTDNDLGEAIIDISIPLRGIDKEGLVAAAERERRRTMRWVLGAITALSLLLVLAVLAGLLALRQRDQAVTQARVALSRQIASASEAAQEEHLPIAMLLAVQAYRTDPNAQTRAALLGADTASPSLVRFIDTPSEVKQVAGAGDGRMGVAGLADGRVLLWRLRGGRPKTIMRLSRQPTAVAIDRDGGVVAAADPSRCLLWRRGHEPLRLPVPGGSHCHYVAVSPSGRTVAYAAAVGGDKEQTITIAPVEKIRRRAVHPDPTAGTQTIVLPSDHRVLLSTFGANMWRTLPGWTGTGELPIGFGALTYEHATSADGRFYVISAGETQVPISSTSAPAKDTQPAFEVEAPLPHQTTLALSPEASEVAVAGPGEIYLAPVDPDQILREQPEGGRLILSGQSADLVSFADDRVLLSAAGREIAVWDTGQLDRLAHSESVHLEAACEECGPPKVAISPNGKRVAVINDNGESGFVQSLGVSPHREPIGAGDYEYELGAPVWEKASRTVAFPAWALSGEISTDTDIDLGVPPDVRTWRAAPSGAEESELAEGPAPNGRDAFLVDEMGTVFEQRIEDGAEISSSADPWADREDEGRASSAAISNSGHLLAISYEDGVRVENLPSRRLVSRIPAAGHEVVAFAGDHLLVLTGNGSGTLQVWDEDGRERQAVIAGAGSGWLAGSPDGALAAISSHEEGTIRLFDLERGAQIGTFRTPYHLAQLKTGVAFSADGSQLVSVSETLGEGNRAALVTRDLSDAALVQTACAAAGRELTASEWRVFVGSKPPSDISC